MRGGRGGSADPGLLVVAPLSFEALLIRLAAPGLPVVRCGMGPRRAQAALPRIAARRAVLLLVMGFCGALDPAAEPGDLIVADEIRHPDGRVIRCQAAEPLAATLAAHGLASRTGPLASLPKLAIGATRVGLRESGAIAVDMEAAWLAAAARGASIGVVRVVVDTPARELVRPWRTLTGSLRAVGSLRAAARALADLPVPSGARSTDSLG